MVAAVGRSFTGMKVFNVVYETVRQVQDGPITQKASAAVIAAQPEDACAVVRAIAAPGTAEIVGLEIALDAANLHYAPAYIS